MRANFLDTPSLPGLQALVLYITTARHAPVSAPIEALLAIAVRLATKLGIHIRPLPKPAQLFITVAQRTNEEMRRRVWWQILALDVGIAEDNQTDPTVWEGMWSCRMPGNLDDVELDAFSNLPLPPRAGETFDPENPYVADSDEIDDFIATYDRRTDMFYALLRIEMSYAMRQLVFSEHFCRVNKYKYLATVAERLQFLDRHMVSIDHRYLQFCTRNDAFSFFARNAVRLILSRHLMVTKSSDGPKTTLHNAIMVLEAAASMRTTHQQWAWSLRSYVELDALELLWKSLVSLSTPLSKNDVSSIGEKMKHAYVLGDAAFQRGEADSLARCYREKWTRIKQLRDDALSQRASEPEMVTTEMM